MSFWPNSLASWMQVIGPVATTAGLAVAWRANWRQGRSRLEDIERAQLEAARLVAVAVGESVNVRGRRLEEATVLNNGAMPILDVRVWFEDLASGRPVMIGDYENKEPAWYVARSFIGAQEQYRWKALSVQLAQAGKLFDIVAFFVSWTSSDGIHWRLRNATVLHREPPARYIGPDSVKVAGFLPDVPRKSVHSD